MGGMCPSRKTPAIHKGGAVQLTGLGVASALACATGAGEGIRTLDPNLGNFFKPSIRQHLFLTRSPLRYYYIRTFLVATRPVGILLLPPETRFFASPMLPRPPPRIPGKQNPEFAL